MSASIRTQFLKENFGYEVIVQELLKRLVEFPGMYLTVPMPIHRGQTIDEWNEEKKEVIKRTIELLKMMGIEYIEHPTEFMIMVGLPK